jgi:hypothetical protein
MRVNPLEKVKQALSARIAAMFSPQVRQVDADSQHADALATFDRFDAIGRHGVHLTITNRNKLRHRMHAEELVRAFLQGNMYQARPESIVINWGSRIKHL